MRYFKCEKCGAGGLCISYACPGCGWDLDRVPAPAVSASPAPVAVPPEPNPPVPKNQGNHWRVV